jgi:hypothetical protein
VPFTIARDGPEMMRTHLRDEFELLLKIGALDEAQLDEANRRGHEASFVPSRPALQTARSRPGLAKGATPPRKIGAIIAFRFGRTVIS